MKNNRLSGFTLMELLVVIVIIGVLATFVAPKIFDAPEKARRTQAEMQVKGISQALELYKLDNRKYPTTSQGLKALVEKPSGAKNWKDGGYMQKMPEDPWGNKYVYLSPGVKGKYDLMSYGADGKKGGTDDDADITSWE